MAVTYGAGQFVAIGYSGLLMSSKDGQHWRRLSQGPRQQLRGAAFGQGKYLVVGEALA